MIKVMVRILLIWMVSAASQAATVIETGGIASGITGLDIDGDGPGTDLYDVIFEFVTFTEGVFEHSDLPGNGDIFMPTEDMAGADAAAIAIVNLLNDWSINVAAINSVGPIASTQFDIPYLYDTGPGCDDLCTSRGSKVVPILPWGFTTGSLGPLASGTFARFTPASAVPVPPAVYLFGSGIIGLAGIARRRRQAVPRV